MNEVKKDKKPFTMTPARQSALRRGQDIRDIRGAIAVLKRLQFRYGNRTIEGWRSLEVAYREAVNFHNRQFGYSCCAWCGAFVKTEIFGIVTFCDDDCRKAFEGFMEGEEPKNG